MKIIASSTLALACFAVAGCGIGGHAQIADSTSHRSFDRSYSASGVAPESRSGDGYPVPSASATPGGREESSESARADRPGLGTEWGETRVSPVHDVTFDRADERPFSIATVYYNDRAGVAAMASYDQRSGAAADGAMPVRGGLTISVVNENGLPLPSFSVAGRVYVAGEAGGRYALRVHNLTNRRYEVVASVDGLDVVDGETATVDKRGYVIDPWGVLLIDGFRRGQGTVAAFRFGAVASSYASRTGSDRDVGVIGLALFSERGSTAWNDDDIERRRTAQPFSDARFAQPPPF